MGAGVTMTAVGAGLSQEGSRAHSSRAVRGERRPGHGRAAVDGLEKKVPERSMLWKS